MRTIVRIKFGSHLYGTNTPSSDLDYKSVFIPEARSLLLQRAKGTINNQRPKNSGEKNTAGDTDEEKISIQRFLELASEGQTMALDMLFAPSWAYTQLCGPEWEEVLANRHKLLTKKSAAFIGYARTQANKYGIKGSRVAAARSALEILEKGMKFHGGSAKLVELYSQIETHLGEFSDITEDTTPHGQKILMWRVCDKQMPYTASIKSARDIMARVVDEYGKRALMAETQQGIDWKALSHAVRVGNQAIELLSTGNVTFPLPNAEHVLKIKKGERLYQDVAEEIENLLVAVEEAAAKSSLPEKADMQWIDDFVADVHYKEITG